MSPDTDAEGVHRAGNVLATRLAGSPRIELVAPLSGFNILGRSRVTPRARRHGLTKLVNAADLALYAAKGAGRDRVLVAGERP